MHFFIHKAHRPRRFAKGVGPSPPRPTTDIVSGLDPLIKLILMSDLLFMNDSFSNGLKTKFINLFKNLFHNIGVVIVGIGIAFLGTRLDSLLGMNGFNSLFTTATAWLLLTTGFLLRVWATFFFYEHGMKVISLVTQKILITSGPYRFSRNPLYLGGNVFIFFGAALLLGSSSGLFITAIHIPLVDLFIRREEKQLEQSFGEEWVRYKKRVRRWL
jgi:protein-S-isoprenylcysteine O-methyltransferase Ste14